MFNINIMKESTYQGIFSIMLGLTFGWFSSFKEINQEPYIGFYALEFIWAALGWALIFVGIYILISNR